MNKIIFLLFLCLGYTKDPSLPEHTLPVYGNASLGYYYVELFVGHPPQQQSVIIDTGSGQLALPCNKCTSCNPKHIDRPFDMSKSKTAEYLTCVHFFSFRNRLILNVRDAHQKIPPNHASFPYHMQRAALFKVSS
jgi:hypothetical protein